MIRNYHPEYGSSMSLNVTIGNLAKAPLEQAQARWGGRLYGYQNPKRKKLLWRWQISSKQASIFLKDIWPYVKVKRGQVVAALEFQDRIDNYNGPWKRTPEEMVERTRLGDVIRSLNSREYSGIYQELKPVGGGCLNCGCGEPSNSHGRPDNITIGDLKKAVKAGGSKSIDEAVKNFNVTVKKAQKGKK